MEIRFKEQPKPNHEMFFSYDQKKEKILLSKNDKDVPIVNINDYKRRSGVLKVACVENDSPFRLHRHKLIDHSGKTQNCNEFGVATFYFKSVDYDAKHELNVELANLTIRRINEAEFNDMYKRWNKIRNNQFDPFCIGFGDLSMKKKIDLNCVRLCCQVFFTDNQKSNFILSEKIQNCKTEIKVHQWNEQTEARINGGDKFYVFISELKTDQREIVAHFFDEQNVEFLKVKPDYIHCNRALRLTVPQYPNRKDFQNRILCKFYLSVENKNYKSEFLNFYYLPECRSCDKNDNLVSAATFKRPNGEVISFEEDEVRRKKMIPPFIFNEFPWDELDFTDGPFLTFNNDENYFP